jgi:hypothetical protein
VNLGRIQTRHVYTSAAVAFALLVGFEGVRMATGNDPALAAHAGAGAATATPDPGGYVDPYGGGSADPYGGGSDDPYGGGDQAQQSVPEPETRLS